MFEWNRLTTEEEVSAYLSDLQRAFDGGDGIAGYTLHIVHSTSRVMPEAMSRWVPTDDELSMKYLIETFHVLVMQIEREKENAEARNVLSHYYQCGMPPVNQVDMTKCDFWNKQSYLAGKLESGGE